MFDALGIAREDDGLAGSDDGRGRLEEDEWLFGNFVAQLSGMRGVVAAHADDLAGLDGGDEANASERPGAFKLKPGQRRRAGKFAHAIDFDDSVDWRGRRLGRLGEKEAAEFHELT